jgi:hypothetical protein
VNSICPAEAAWLRLESNARKGTSRQRSSAAAVLLLSLEVAQAKPATDGGSSVCFTTGGGNRYHSGGRKAERTLTTIYMTCPCGSNWQDTCTSSLNLLSQKRFPRFKLAVVNFPQLSSGKVQGNESLSGGCSTKQIKTFQDTAKSIMVRSNNIIQWMFQDLPTLLMIISPVPLSIYETGVPKKS